MAVGPHARLAWDAVIDVIDQARYSSTRARRAAAAVAITAAVAVAAAGVWWVNAQWSNIPRFDHLELGTVAAPPAPPPPAVTSPPDTTPAAPATTVPEPAAPGRGRPERTFLIFSTGSAGVDIADADRLGIGTDRLAHADGITDTVMFVAVDDRTVRVLSLPRDLWLPWRNARLNASYNRAGAQGLVDDVTRIVGVPVDHVVAVNFTGFAELTDLVGGVNVWVDGPARDRASGFTQQHSGCRHFDGRDALAFVRARKWEVQDGNGRWRYAASASDFGRIERQQQFLAAVASKLVTAGSIPKAGQLASIAHGNVTLDASFGLGDAVSFASRFLRGATVEMATVPSRTGQVGKASVVFEDHTEDTYVWFSGTGPAPQAVTAVDVTSAATPSTVSAPSGTAPAAGAPPGDPAPACTP